jgi:hypothetical protein
MNETMTGGCQCGRIRYSAEVTSDEAYLCHCRMCRHATGGAAAAFVNLAIDKLSWLQEPDWYQSSPIARRPFCATCGTPLGFAFLKDATNIDITLGSFDDPARFRPVSNYATESILSAWQDTSHLPGSRSEENSSVTDRWIEAIGKLPD